MSKSGVVRHLSHLPRTLLEAKATDDITRADILIGQICKIQRQTEVILKRAMAGGELELALRAIRELVRITDLSQRTVEKHTSQTKERIGEDFPDAIDQIIGALQPYPNARAAAAKALTAVKK